MSQFNLLSHNILTPLNAIFGFSEALKKTSLSHPQDQMINYILNNSYDLFEVLKGICHFHDNDKKAVDISEMIKGRNILIVEDDERCQKINQLFLEKAGATVDFASNGLEALKKLQSGVFDLALMDISMPQMDGLETIRHLRNEDSEIKNTPVIAITANSSQLWKKQCLEAGFNDYISKPTRSAELLNAVAFWVNKSKLKKEKDQDPLQKSTQKSA